MKSQYTMIIATILLALCLAGTAHATLFSGPSLNASLLYYQPVPASPGSLLDVFVQINNAGETANKVDVAFVDTSPFSLDSESDRTKTIEMLPGQQSFLVKYKVRVSQDASPGLSTIKIQYSIGGKDPQNALLPIDVFSQTASLNIEDIAFSPESLVPGSVGKLSFNVKNSAPIKIRDGTVTLDLTGLNIVPVDGTNQQQITDLQAGDMAQFSFTLAAAPDLAPGIYKLPIALDFNDQQGRNYKISQYVGVRVGAQPEVSVTIDTSKLTSDVKSGDVIIRVTNKGLGQVKFADIVLGKDASYDLLSGSEERYVGSVDSDDYKTASVTMQANSNTVNIPYVVTYMDSLNTPYTKKGTLTLSLRSSGSSGFSWSTAVIVVLVLGIGAYFLFFRKKKAR